jgi:hypothetical protein
VKIKAGRWYKLVEDHDEKAMFDGIYSYFKAIIAKDDLVTLDVYDFIQGLDPVNHFTATTNPPIAYKFREASEAEVSESLAWIAGRLLVGRVRL